MNPFAQSVLAFSEFHVFLVARTQLLTATLRPRGNLAPSHTHFNQTYYDDAKKQATRSRALDFLPQIDIAIQCLHQSRTARAGAERVRHELLSIESQWLQQCAEPRAIGNEDAMLDNNLRSLTSMAALVRRKVRMLDIGTVESDAIDLNRDIF